MNRRQLLFSATTLPLVGPILGRVVTNDVPPMFQWDPITIVRLERDGSLSVHDGHVDGRLYRPGNELREYRAEFGHDPSWWSNSPRGHERSAGDRDPHWPPGRTEEYYENKLPTVGVFYWDRARYDAGILPDPGVYRSQVAHIDDAGAGLHRWIRFTDRLHTDWKWTLGSISPKQAWEAIDRDPTRTERLIRMFE